MGAMFTCNTLFNLDECIQVDTWERMEERRDSLRIPDGPLYDMGNR